MRSLSEHFLSACAYAGLRFPCTTPPESSIRQCVPAHSLTSTLRQTHAVACLVLLLYARNKSMSMKFLKTIFGKIRPESGQNKSHRETYFGGEHHTRHSRKRRPRKGQIQTARHAVRCAAPDGAEIHKRAESHCKAIRIRRQRGKHSNRTVGNGSPRDCP